MTTSADLFRREALEYWSRQQGPSGVLQLRAPWVRWLYWVVLALVAAGLALTLLLRIEQTTSGPALVDPQERTFVAVLPAAAGSDLPGGRAVRLEVDGARGGQSVAAAVLQVQAAENADVERAGFLGSFPSPAVLVTGVLSPNTAALDAAAPAGTAPSPGLTGRAVVQLASKRASSVLLEGFV